MKKILLILFLLPLYGCSLAQSMSLNNYYKTNYQLAETGQLKWSDYYKGLYSELEKTNFPYTGSLLSSANHMIQVSENYEMNKITKSQFEYEQRQTKADISNMENQSNQESNKRISESLKNLQKTIPVQTYNPNPYNIHSPGQQNKTTRCHQEGNQFVCTESAF
jgi:hypothetical protein